MGGSRKLCRLGEGPPRSPGGLGRLPSFARRVLGSDSRGRGPDEGSWRWPRGPGLLTPWWTGLDPLLGTARTRRPAQPGTRSRVWRRVGGPLAHGDSQERPLWLWHTPQLLCSPVPRRPARGMSTGRLRAAVRGPGPASRGAGAAPEPEPLLSPVRRPETTEVSRAAQSKQSPRRAAGEGQRGHDAGAWEEEAGLRGQPVPGPSPEVSTAGVSLSPEVAPAPRPVLGLLARASDFGHRDTRMLFLSRMEAANASDSGKQGRVVEPPRPLRPDP